MEHKILEFNVESLNDDIIVIIYDSNSNELYCKYSTGFEEWTIYDECHKIAHKKNSKGYEVWHTYDSIGRIIHRRDSEGINEYWKEYGHTLKSFHYKSARGVEVWYDNNGDKITEPQWNTLNDKIHYANYTKDSSGREEW